MRIMELSENVTPEERLARMDQLLDEMLSLTDELPELEKNAPPRKEDISTLSEHRC